ncbi:hypothetical protein RchiOBHm_Chr6g0253201 [Rosa chinensis]|uniref:Uncharacterized protein n=1 Tax=Rosa chinensis TaxID=74649 RepID=A0A2P6PL95_ROSCH|nr:hypothetical protein RchiOBHm_Chr6g0253201 [Rosa chinensis]
MAKSLISSQPFRLEELIFGLTLVYAGIVMYDAQVLMLTYLFLSLSIFSLILLNW